MSFKLGIKIAATTIVFAVIFGYAYARIESFARGPYITIEYPAYNQATSSSSIVIKGEVRNASHITVNGRQVYTNESGLLAESVLLSEGLNVFEVAAKDRFNRTAKKVLTIIH